MADWEFTTADKLTAQQWASKWWREARIESYFYSKGFIGPSYTKNIIIEFPDLMEKQGYKLTFGQIRDLTGDGVTGDSDLEGNEEVPLVYDDAIELEQKRNAIRTQGKLSDQYPSDKAVREWAKDLLRQWKADILDQDMFTALGTDPSKIIYGGDATGTASIAAGDYFTTNLASKFRAYARKASPQITGVPMGGRRNYVIVIGPDQNFDLKTRDAAWSQAQREAQKPGNDNKLFTGAAGLWDNCIIQEHERAAITAVWGGGSVNGATALGMGVGAAGIAFAKKSIWNEKSFDYGNKIGFAIGAIWGQTKAVFNSADNALVAIRTYRTNN